ncbi:hypothetical protein [Nocardia jiangxiensis]|uniref:Uncharacterized protein n=1 Tax=Nocardia jiangxiensis TaxID=282685 RepID=A0ABW6RQW4_9NOCA|nr:hypothetical protein [Nocardia jiangxiensis]
MPQTARSVAILLGSLGAVAAIASSAVAGAQTVQFPQTPSLFFGGLCGGNIRTWADTSPDYAGRAVFNVQAQPIQGVGSGSYPLAPLCNVDTTIAWRNLNTGAAGQWRVNVVSGIYGSILYAVYQNTGPGRIDVTVTTNNLSVPSHATFDVPAPPGH